MRFEYHGSPGERLALGLILLPLALLLLALAIDLTGSVFGVMGEFVKALGRGGCGDWPKVPC